ncbi:MAG: hypothetical protein ACI9S8_000223 [Chlamydiales bacterium]|jgi:hypothetical protein
MQQRLLAPAIIRSHLYPKLASLQTAINTITLSSEILGVFSSIIPLLNKISSIGNLMRDVVRLQH